MAKKKLILNESTTRQFMKYANIKPTYVSNFLKEAEEMEDDAMMDDPELDDEAKPKGDLEPEMDMGMETEDEMEMDTEGGDAEAIVMDLLSTIKGWAKTQGVSMELEGDEDEDMEDMDAAPEGGDIGLADDADVDADLEAAGAEALDDEEVIAEVTRRVARRLLRESAKRRK